MRALVAIKRVVDYAARIRVKLDKSGVDTSSVKMSMNPFCEIAVEEALRLKESCAVEEVVAVSIGVQECQETLRTALAMGADRAILVQVSAAHEHRLEPLTVAKILSHVAVREAAGLVLLGKQAIDDDSSQTGQMLAALLGWPQATAASKVEVRHEGPSASASAVVTQEVDDGLATVEVALPAVITADLRLNAPRYASLPGLMRAKRRPIAVLTPSDVGVPLDVAQWAGQRVAVQAVEEPPPRRPGRIVGSVDELLACLREEAKVL